MKFYSYDYVSSQIKTENWLIIFLFSILLVMIGYFSIKSYQNKRDTKYRELVIILILSTLLFGLISFSNYQTNKDSTNQYRASLHFIELISKKLNVDKETIYINTSSSTDGAILKVGPLFYRAISSDSSNTYLLEQIELYQPEIELVEVK